MMQVLRNNTKVIIWVLVIAFVGTIIFAWGMDLSGTRGGGGKVRDFVGSVDGRKIPVTNFNYAADQWIEGERKKNPDKDFTESDYRQARDEAWTEFVQTLLQQGQIEKKKIRLTDPELYDFIRRYPPQDVQQVQQFQTDGKFDYKKYLAAMSDPQFAQFWPQVETMMRDRLTNFKLNEYIGSMVRVSDNELQDRYLRDNERIKVDYALVPISANDYATIKIDSSQVRDYYNNHPDEFKTLDQAYYTVIRAIKKPSADDNAKAFEQITAIKRELDNGANFDTLAAQYTMDASGKGNGGDLGWFGHGQMVQPFDSAVFAMKDSTISAPVKTQFGYHIIYRKGIRTTNGAEQVHAAHILIKSSPSSETIENLSQTMEKFRGEVNNSNYAELLKKYDLQEDTPKKTGRNGAIFGIGKNPDMEKFLFDSKPGTFSQVIDRQDAIYMFRADRVTAPGTSPLSEVSGLIEQNLRREEQKKATLLKAQQIYDAITRGVSLADAAKTVGTTMTESGFFARSGRLPSIGQDPNFIGTAFSLSEANKFSKPVLTQSGAAVIEFKEKIPAGLDGFSAQKDTLRSQELMSLQNSYWDNWFVKIRDNAKIEDYRKDVYGEQM